MVFLSEKEIFKLKSFEIDSKEVEISRSEEIKLHIDEGEKYESNELADIYDALVMGTKDYVDKNGFKGIIIGSSGGIDSALTATIAFDALGSSRVNTVMMPFDYTADMSIEDAKELAENLSINHSVISLSLIHI